MPHVNLIVTQAARTADTALLANMCWRCLLNMTADSCQLKGQHSGTLGLCKHASSSCSCLAGMTTCAFRASQTSSKLRFTLSKLLCLPLPGDPTNPKICINQCIAAQRAQGCCPSEVKMRASCIPSIEGLQRQCTSGFSTILQCCTCIYMEIYIPCTPHISYFQSSQSQTEALNGLRQSGSRQCPSAFANTRTSSTTRLNELST